VRGHTTSFSVSVDTRKELVKAALGGMAYCVDRRREFRRERQRESAASIGTDHTGLAAEQGKSRATKWGLSHDSAADFN
jgi:hypothetical protein